MQLTSKQKEMIQQQLEKESAVRKRLLEVRERSCVSITLQLHQKIKYGNKTW